MEKILVKLGLELETVKMAAEAEGALIVDRKIEVRASGVRWYILAMYVYYATISCFQWVEYSIITNIVMRYYDVSSDAVDWTGVMFMVVWPIFVFPSSFLIDKLGLRFAALVGCFFTAIGTFVKVFSIGRHLFFVVLVGQAIVSLSQVFILSLPPKLAAVWFKPNEMSRVCSIGVFGMQLGSALGFLLPPMIVQDVPDVSAIGQSLKRLCWGLAIAIIPVCIAIVIYFPATPEHPPSQAQVREREKVQTVTLKTFLKSLKDLVKNVGFLVHTLAYSISFGIFSAFGTLLNQFVLSYFPGAVEDAGCMGLVMITSGMTGGFLVGLVLDKTHKYKETNLIIYICSAICLGMLLLSLQLHSRIMVYLTIAIFGFFLNAYIPAGIEFASELTYPANESTATGLMTAASQTLGIVFTLLLGHLNQSSWGSSWALIVQIVLLSVGSLLTALVPNDLRRRDGFVKGGEVEFEELPQKEPLV